MDAKNMRYGQFLKAKRISDSRELTLKDVAAELGVSFSYVSDIEQGRRKPYDEVKTQKLIEYLKLSEDEVALISTSLLLVWCWTSGQQRGMIL